MPSTSRPLRSGLPSYLQQNIVDRGAVLWQVASMEEHALARATAIEGGFDPALTHARAAPCRSVSRQTEGRMPPWRQRATSTCVSSRAPRQLDGPAAAVGTADHAGHPRAHAHMLGKSREIEALGIDEAKAPRVHVALELQRQHAHAD